MTGDMKGSLMRSGFGGSLCALSLRVSSVLCHTSAKAAVKNRANNRWLQPHEVRVEYAHELIISGPNVKPTEQLIGEWFSTDLLWKIIQSATSDTASLGSDSQINTVHSSPTLWATTHSCDKQLLACLSKAVVVLWEIFYLFCDTE